MERGEEICLSKADEEHALVGPHEHDETEVDPCDECVSVKSILAGNVAETQDIQTSLSTTSCGIDGEENGPCDASTNESDEDQDFEETEEKVAIEGIVVEDESVRFRAIAWDPAEGALLVIVYPVARCVLARAMGGGMADSLLNWDDALLASGVVDSVVLAAQDEEEGDHHDGSEKGRDEGGDHGRQRAAAAASTRSRLSRLYHG